jgi:hypothetical protein
MRRSSAGWGYRQVSRLNGAAHEELLQIEPRHLSGLKKGNDNGVRPGFQWHFERRSAVVDGVPSGDVFIPIEQFDALAVSGKFMLNLHGAAGAERHAFYLHLLRGISGTRHTVSVAAVTVPVAMRLILAAAETYDSSSAGEIEIAPAMLSKPRVESSEGRYFCGIDRNQQQVAVGVSVLGWV